MAEPAPNNEGPSEGQSGDSDSLASPASAEVASAEPHETDTYKPAALPGAVATVWSSILSIAHRRLGKRQ
ncbi:hypothetical protein B046DRAFT_04551 [Streptomyces sp. LamerLS-316]|nr:hypothetical protein B046DRAFT_04551 [Streptomyces sp. LamerLS-316]